MSTTEHWAVILGASSGTGAAIARAVAVELGLNVFGVHRGNHLAGAAAVVRDVESVGRRAVMRVADAGSASGAEEGVQQLRDVVRPCNVALMVHALANASVGRLIDPDGRDLAPRQVEKTFDSMAHSFVYWTRALYRQNLLARNARILGLTNPLTESTLRNCGLIAASKAALEMYVRHLAMDLGPQGYRVNLLKFGTVVTPALRHVFGEEAVRRSEAVHARMIPAGRMVTVEEVAAFVVTLCTERAAWFNGATIDFTGGMTNHLLELLVNPSSEEG